MDPDVFALVTGRARASSAGEPAVLRGFRPMVRAGASYPILTPAPEARVEGLIVTGLTATEIERLKTFEGAEYDLVAATVESPARGVEIPIRLFMAKPGIEASEVAWSLADWRRRHKDRYLSRLGAARRVWTAD